MISFQEIADILVTPVSVKSKSRLANHSIEFLPNVNETNLSSETEQGIHSDFRSQDAHDDSFLLNTHPSLTNSQQDKQNSCCLSIAYRIIEKEYYIEIDFQSMDEHDDLFLLNTQSSFAIAKQNKNSYIFFNIYAMCFSFASFLSGMWCARKSIPYMKRGDIIIATNTFFKRSEKLLSHSVASVWMLVFQQQILSRLINRQLLQMVDEIDKAIENSQWENVSKKLESNLIKFSLHYVSYKLLGIKQEIVARLWYYKGRVAELHASLSQQAIENYRMAYKLACSDEMRFSITKHLYEKLSFKSIVNATEMKMLINSLLKNSSCLQSEWAKLFSQIKIIQQLLLNDKINEAYNLFIKIPFLPKFMQKVYPRLFTRYCQLQVTFTLICQEEIFTKMSVFDRLSLAIHLLENSVNMLNLIHANSNSFKNTLCQLHTLSSNLSPKLSHIGMYGATNREMSTPSKISPIKSIS